MSCCCNEPTIEVDGGKLWQWDIGRYLVVLNVPVGCKANFAHMGDDRALVLTVEDLRVRIPDEMLQGGDILVWLVQGDRTLTGKILHVRRRPKPDSYIYTPTETETLDGIKKWVESMIDPSTGGIKGEKGDPGTMWYTGAGNPNAGARVGDLYLDTATGEYFQYGEQE